MRPLGAGGKSGRRAENIPRRCQPSQPTTEKFDYELTSKEKQRKLVDDDLMRLQIERDQVLTHPAKFPIKIILD
jgi:hypothetical protein